MNDADPGADLVERLKDVQVGIRPDLDVSRHLFRDRVSYVVQDPLTFQTHRFSLEDYRILVSIRADRTLGDVFDDLVASETLDADEEEAFYQFVISLHQYGFLNLPISDDKSLYRRYVARRRAKWRQWALGVLFLQIPLINPDGFLNRTIRYARPFFTGWALVAWLVLVGTAALLSLKHWDKLLLPINNVFTAGNLGLVWITLIALKVFHEFGHAYACKKFGGHVPEMGVFLVVFTPCAYVDATASWGFSSRLQRLIVCMGGIYVELAIASIALFVWCFTEPSLINSVAYNVFLLAGITTVAFNVNPLMRYDGYYALSDILEIPNLRQRSQKALLDVAKERLFGLQVAARGEVTKGSLFLAGFGVLTSIYKVTIVLGIAFVISTKFLLIGMILGGSYILMEVTRTLSKALRWLWFSPEAKPARLRAVLASVVLIVAVPAALLYMPVPGYTIASGVLGRERETVVISQMPGFVTAVHVDVGQRVPVDTPLVDMENLELLESFLGAEGRSRAAEITHLAASFEDPGLARQEKERVRLYRNELDARQDDLDQLTVRASAPGTVVKCLPEDDVGRYVAPGEVIATIGSGAWVVNAVLSERDVAMARPKVGQRVEFRSALDPGTTFGGAIARVSPTGVRFIADVALTQPGGGDIPVDPETGNAANPYYAISVELERSDELELLHGVTGRIKLGGSSDSLGLVLFRGLLRFANSLR